MYSFGSVGLERVLVLELNAHQREEVRHVQIGRGVRAGARTRRIGCRRCDRRDGCHDNISTNVPAARRGRAGSFSSFALMGRSGDLTMLREIPGALSARCARRRRMTAARLPEAHAGIWRSAACKRPAVTRGSATSDALAVVTPWRIPSAAMTAFGGLRPAGRRALPTRHTRHERTGSVPVGTGQSADDTPLCPHRARSRQMGRGSAA